MTNTKYAKIKFNDIVDGEGICVSFWTQGCPFRCPGCHNPELWDYNNGNTLFTEKVINFITKELTLKSYIDGLTFCGGDPLDQSEAHLKELLQFIKQIKKNVKRKFNIWIYTGDIYENIIQKESQLNILKECDVLVDGPYEQDKRNITLAFRGSENQRLIDLKKSLGKGKIIKLDLDEKN